MNFLQIAHKVYYFLFLALIRQKSAEWKAHDPRIIFKIEVQHLKNEMFVSINQFQINVSFLYPIKT